MSARNKFLINKAVVGWHGAPGIPSEEQWSQLSEEKRVRVNQQIEQHKQFFAILRSQGIREELTNDPPPNPSGDSDKAYWRSHFWSYNERILDEKFGVKNVFRVTVESDAVK